MSLPDLIRVKRDGGRLERAAIRELVAAVTDNRLTDVQLGALLMAIYLQGLDATEQASLTLAMRDSGTVLRWNDLDGPVLDKHSTGGVGDLVSLVLAPLLAACGAYVPMISGRGLGHTGGTLDKLESIPGFNVSLELPRFQAIVREHGFALVGQGDDLAPADRRIYAARDVSETVSCQPLVVASILSKKLAEGLDGLVMDVKTGRGAVFADPARARALAQALCDVAGGAGLDCHAVLTDMDQPLAAAAGNALEVREAIAFLAGERHGTRLETVVLALASEALIIGELAPDTGQAKAKLASALDSGAAAERFAAVVAAQGGPGGLVETPDEYLPTAPVQCEIRAQQAGHVQQVDALAIGRLVRGLGGGRFREDDRIDPAVGVNALVSAGDRVERGQVLAVIHARDDDAAQRAATDLSGMIQLGEAMPDLPSTIQGVIRNTENRSDTDR